MHTQIDSALADVRQAQDVVLIQLRTFLASPSRDAAARLDCAIADQSSAVEHIAGGRFDYLARMEAKP